MSSIAIPSGQMNHMLLMSVDEMAEMASGLAIGLTLGGHQERSVPGGNGERQLKRL